MATFVGFLVGALLVTGLVTMLFRLFMQPLAAGIAAGLFGTAAYLLIKDEFTPFYLLSGIFWALIVALLSQRTGALAPSATSKRAGRVGPHERAIPATQLLAGVLLLLPVGFVVAAWRGDVLLAVIFGVGLALAIIVGVVIAFPRTIVRAARREMAHRREKQYLENELTRAKIEALRRMQHGEDHP